MIPRKLRPVPVLFLFLVLLVMAGCAPLEKRVDLAYEPSVKAAGGSGEIFVARPVVKQQLSKLPSGRQIVGKAGDADVTVEESPAGWLLSALSQELSAAGYVVKTGATLPAGVPKGVKATIIALSADQTSAVMTVTTVTEVKLEAELWRDGHLLKTLTAEAKEQDEGMDRSSGPIRSALEKTLQRAMLELVPEIVKALE